MVGQMEFFKGSHRGATTISIMTISITVLSILGLKHTVMLSGKIFIVTLNAITLSVITLVSLHQCHYTSVITQVSFTEYHLLSVITLDVNTLSVVTIGVVMLSVVTLTNITNSAITLSYFTLSVAVLSAVICVLLCRVPLLHNQGYPKGISQNSNFFLKFGVLTIFSLATPLPYQSSDRLRYSFLNINHLKKQLTDHLHQ